MSLKTFHIVFVTLSTLVAFLFTGWSVHYWSVQGDGSYLAMGIASALLGGLLIPYGIWFWRKITTREEEDRRRRKNIHPVPVMVSVWLLGNRAAMACQVCYGDAEGPMIDAARLGVFLLFGLVLLMQVSFALFFVYLWKRARRFRTLEAGQPLAER